MSAETAPASRPLLLPQNRKIRHLRGLYLRNLSFTRPRGRTVDDAAIIESPGRREAPQLHHALSSESLRQPAAASEKRRRSTNLSGAAPFTRQKKLEYAIESRIADSFFSLHCRGEKDAVYISEVSERATNFNFRFFDLTQLDSSITRLPQLTVRIWTKRQGLWSLLIQEEVDLRFLNYIGNLRTVHFPPNSLVFHLVDGAYSLELSTRLPPAKQTTALPTTSYNALMRLATLGQSIQDALATRESIAEQINQILAETPTNEVPQAEDKARLAKRYLLRQRRALLAVQKRKDELRTSIEARRAAIESGRNAQEKAALDVEHASGKLQSSKELVAATQESIHGQRRRICEDLMRIYNICPIPLGPPLAFQICDTALPNTSYDGSLTTGPASEDAISAALGHVALLTNALQYYLGVPLPYPISPFGSRSSIRDDISLLADPHREFPLYLPRGGSSAQFRFDYGWFLLNKDIEALCNAQGLKVVDIRHTLPNLKYLLYVCSAGTDELPERKKGGVRGLWVGRMRGRAVGGLASDGRAGRDGSGSSRGGSRRGSADSDLLAHQRDELRKVIKEHARDPVPSAAGFARSLLSPTGSPFDSEAEGEGALGGRGAETKLTLRTKGLRENVVR